MKTKLLAISLLLFTSQVFSEEAKVLKEETLINGGVKLRVVCIDGYKYLNTSRLESKKEVGFGGGLGVALAIANSTIQMFEERDGKSLPVRCSSKPVSSSKPVRCTGNPPNCYRVNPDTGMEELIN